MATARHLLKSAAILRNCKIPNTVLTPGILAPRRRVQCVSNSIGPTGLFRTFTSIKTPSRRSRAFNPNNTTVRTMSTTIKTHESLTPVSTSQAPAAIGPYSQGIKAGGLLFCSGCIPLDPVSMEIVPGGVEEQTEQALKNLKAVVEAGGAELGKVVKTTVFLKSMNDFVAVNGIYAKYFGDHKPARSAVEVARLPKDVLVEVEAIVSLS